MEKAFFLLEMKHPVVNYSSSVMMCCMFIRTRTRCQPCTSECTVQHQVIVQSCTLTHDTVCQCKGGYYLRSPHDLACEKHKSCPPGEGVKTQGMLAKISGIQV